MGAIASQITGLTNVYSTVYSDADQRKHQSSASPVPGEFPAQMASNPENVSIWWRLHEWWLSATLRSSNEAGSWRKSNQGNGHVLKQQPKVGDY